MAKKLKIGDLVTMNRNPFFKYLNDGSWLASSEANPDLVYGIVVCDDGTFDVSEESSPELGLKDQKTFDLFRDAKRFCDDREARLCEEVVVGQVG